MKRAIAMKCNQKQWDAIKGKLVDFEIRVSYSFIRFPYLVNTKAGGIDSINNYSLMYEKRELHETWNEQIFLEACGIETVFKGSELQYWSDRESKWYDVSSVITKYRLKPKKDNSAEIAELERQIKKLENEQ